jgi:ribonuclease J
MLVKHRELSWECGIAKERTFFIENGAQITIEDGQARVTDQFDLHPKLIDHGMQVALNSRYLKDRRSLSETGVVAVGITVDFQTLNMLHEPIIQEYGFIPKYHRNDFREDVIRKIEKKLASLKQKNKLPDLETELKGWVRQVTSAHFDQKPAILPIVIEA